MKNKKEFLLNWIYAANTFCEWFSSGYIQQYDDDDDDDDNKNNESHRWVQYSSDDYNDWYLKTYQLPKILLPTVHV
jgi:hypothetical protein